MYIHTILSELRSGEDSSKFLKVSPWFSDWSVTLQWKQMQSQQRKQTQDAGGLKSAANWNWIPLSVRVLQTHTLHVDRINQNEHNFLLCEISKCIIGHSGAPRAPHLPGLPLSIGIEINQTEHPAKDHQAHRWNKNKERMNSVCVRVSSVNHRADCALAEQRQTTGTSTLRRRNKSRTARQSPVVSSRCCLPSTCYSDKVTLDRFTGKLDFFLFLEATM